jgi:hypothetical protein
MMRRAARGSTWPSAIPCTAPGTIGPSGQLGRGTPIAVIQAQLGHGLPMLTRTKYVRFLPSASDRAMWEAEATKYEQARGEAR